MSPLAALILHRDVAGFDRLKVDLVRLADVAVVREVELNHNPIVLALRRVDGDPRYESGIASEANVRHIHDVRLGRSAGARCVRRSVTDAAGPCHNALDDAAGVDPGVDANLAG